MILEDLKEKIFNREPDNGLLETWDCLMQEYGWIPFYDFASLDAGVVTKLFEIIEKRNKKSKGGLTKKGVVR